MNNAKQVDIAQLMGQQSVIVVKPASSLRSKLRPTVKRVVLADGPQMDRLNVSRVPQDAAAHNLQQHQSSRVSNVLQVQRHPLDRQLAKHVQSVGPMSTCSRHHCAFAVLQGDLVMSALLSAQHVPGDGRTWTVMLQLIALAVRLGDTLWLTAPAVFTACLVFRMMI